MAISPFKSSSIQFIKDYNFKVITNPKKIIIIDKDHKHPISNTIMIILGLAGIPICYAGSYEIGIIFLLLLLFPIIRIANNRPKKVVFDFANQTIQNVKLIDIRKFVFVRSEVLAYASAFEKGVIDYSLTLQMVNKNNIGIDLMTFIDRQEVKPGAELLLQQMNEWLNDKAH